MSRYIVCIFCFVAMVMYSGCSNHENIMDADQGYVDIETKIDATFRTVGGQTVILSEDLIPHPDSMAFTLTASDGAQHTWRTLTEFRESLSSYMPGRYTARLSGRTREDAPLFEATGEFVMEGGNHVTLHLDVHPAQAMLCIHQTLKTDKYKLQGIVLRESVNGFSDIIPAETVVFVNPGETGLFAVLADAENTVYLSLDVTSEMQAAYVYDLDLILTDASLTVGTTGVPVVEIDLSDGLPQTHPVITVSGFTPGIPLDVDEGVTLSEPLLMNVASETTPLSHVYINVVSPMLESLQLPYSSLDLLNLSDEQRRTLHESGFRFSISADKRALQADFTEVVQNLATQTTEVSNITMMAQDKAGACSPPVTMVVSTKEVQLELLACSTALVGEDKADVTIKSNVALSEDVDFRIFAKDENGAYTLNCPITAMSPAGDDCVRLVFTVPQGLEDVDITIQYLGINRLHTTIPRENPAITMDIDAFATTAVIRLNVSVGSASGSSYVISKIRPYVNGAPASIWQRYPDSDAIIINGLEQNSRYKVEMRLVGDKVLAQTEIKTERASSFPGDFTDYHTIIDYKHMASGGRFSATSIPIVNRQNFTDISVLWPKKLWASMNTLTFYKESTNHNTWYMQPSAVLEPGPTTGTRSMCLTSVGYDHDGAEIPDYVQPIGADPTPYSMSIPQKKHTIAGQAWLGSYSYDEETNTETITYGEPFTSRPSSLNGYYKYLTDLTDGTDYGTVEIQLVHVDDTGVETEVAAGRMEFRTAPDYKAFNVPLSYTLFNVRPTHLRVHFKSSYHTADQVPVTAHPITSTFTGSTLWITSLTFSY